MAFKNTHLIEKQIFDICLENQADVNVISNELAELFAVELSSFLDDFFSNSISKEFTLRIPSLEIDLGTIEFSKFSGVFSNRFRQKISDIFNERYFSIEGSLSPAKVLDTSDRDLELLRFFILRGYYPWWAGRSEKGLDPLFRKLITIRKRKTREMVMMEGRALHFRQRIILQFQDETLYRLFGILSANPENFFRYHVEDLIAIHQKRKIVSEEGRKLKKVVQELILTYLLDHHATSVDQVAFLRFQLEKLVVKYGVSYRRLVSYIRETLGMLSQNGFVSKSGMMPLVEVLYKEILNPGKAATPVLSSSYISTDFEALQIFLSQGYYNYHRGSSRFKSKDALLLWVIKANQDAFLAVLYDIGRNQTVRRRIINTFHSDAIKKIFGVLTPSNVTLLYTYFEIAEHVQARIAPINQEKIQFRKIIQELALKSLIEKKKSQLNSANFLKQQLQLLSSHYHVGYKSVVQLLYAEVTSMIRPSKFMGNFLDNLQELYDKIQLDQYVQIGALNRSKIAEHLSGRANSDKPQDSPFIASRQSDNTETTQTSSNLATIIISSLSQLNRRGILKELYSVEIGNEQTLHLLTPKLRSEPREKWAELILSQLIPVGYKDRKNMFKGLLFQLLSGLDGVSTQSSRAEKSLLATFLRAVVIQDRTRVTRLYRYKAFLDFMLERKSMIPVGNSLRVLRQIDLPSQLDQSAIEKFIYLIVPRKALSFFQFTLFAAQYKWGLFGRVGQNTLFRYVVIRLLQEPKMRLDLRYFSRDILLYLESVSHISHDQIAQGILKNTDQLSQHLSQVLTQLVSETKNKKKETTDNHSADTFRTSLPDLLFALGILSDSNQENLDDTALIQMLEEYLYNRTSDFIDILKKNRFDERVFDNILENLKFQEVAFLLKEVLKEKYTIWEKAYEAVLKFQQHFASFKIPAEQLSFYILPWTFQYILSISAGKFKAANYHYYLFEQLHARSLIDMKRLTKLLNEPSSKGKIPPVLMGVLEEFMDQDILFNLRPSFVRAQYSKDLLIYYLQIGQKPFWADESDISLHAISVMIKTVIREKDVSMIQNIIALSQTEMTLSRLKDVLGAEDTYQFLNLLGTSDAEQGIGSFFKEIETLFKGLRRDLPPAVVSSKLFLFFLKERLWTYSTNTGRGMTLLEKIADYLTIDRELLISVVEKGGSKSLRDSFLEVGKQLKPSFSEVEKIYKDIFIYLIDNGQWPSGLSRDVVQKALDSIRQKVLSNNIADLLETVKSSNDGMRGVRHLTKVLNEQYLLEIIQTSLWARRTSHPMLFQLLTALLDAIIAPGAPLKKVDLVALLLEYSFFGKKHDAQAVQSFARDFWRIAPSYYEQFSAQLAQKAPVQMAEKLLVILQQVKGKEDANAEEHRWTILRHYLQFGTIGSQYPDYNKKRLLEDIYYLFSQSETLFRKQLFTLWKIRTSRTLFLSLFEDHQVRGILQFMDAELSDALQSLESTLAESELGGLWEILTISDDRALVVQIGEIWIKGNQKIMDPTVIVNELFNLYAKKLQFRPSILIKKLMDKDLPAETGNRRMLETLNAKIAAEERIARKIVPEVPTQENISNPKEGIHVYNAGISLIWPFLGRFFRRLNMVEGDDFLNEAMRMRAVLLCQFIVTGNTIYQENELVLNKMLCGMELQTVVENELDIREDERTLAESMLAGVIHNWEKLQGTRINTFRETFLQREGRLTWHEEGHWELVVEKRAYDVLLTTLPWQIKMIKYGWMKNRLLVLWN